MEVALATGEPLSRLQETLPKGRLIWIGPSSGLLRQRGVYAKIDQRYLKMLNEGGIEEARQFAARKLDPSLPLMKAVGLPPLLDYFKGALDLDAL